MMPVSIKITDRQYHTFCLTEKVTLTQLILLSGVSNVDLEIIKKIEVKDIDKIDKNTGLTILHAAISCKNLELIKIFLDKGASIDKKNSHGRDAYYYATQSNDPEIMALINSHSKYFSCTII